MTISGAEITVIEDVPASSNGRSLAIHGGGVLGDDHSGIDGSASNTSWPFVSTPFHGGALGVDDGVSFALRYLTGGQNVVRLTAVAVGPAPLPPPRWPTAAAAGVAASRGSGQVAAASARKSPGIMSFVPEP
ncbi:MAG: hypothetical protein H6977_18025 [Gammaproteobacteria bacterium]|nr:hypothetical protein [Gammaproteobacteria bacterium]